MEEFLFKDLEAYLNKQNIEKAAMDLLDVVEWWMSPRDVLRCFRTYYYNKGNKDYDSWFNDEDSESSFYATLLSIVDVELRREQFSEQIKVVKAACRGGEAGKKLFANIAVWLHGKKLIRDDITIQKAKLFEYIDSYCYSGYILKETIFNWYDKVKSLEEISAEAYKYLQENLSEYEYEVLMKQVNSDEPPKCINRRAAKQDRLGAVHRKIEHTLAEGIYKIIVNG